MEKYNDCGFFEQLRINSTFTLVGKKFTKTDYNNATGSGKYWEYLFETQELVEIADNTASFA